VLALALLPLLLLAKDNRHPYQFYKLFCCVSPLFPAGVALLCASPRAAVSSWWRRLACWSGQVPVAASLVLAAAGTAAMTHQGDDRVPGYRSYSYMLHAPDLRELQRVLPGLKKGNLVLAYQDHTTRGIMTSWLSYFGRQQRIWLANPEFFQDTK